MSTKPVSLTINVGPALFSYLNYHQSKAVGKNPQPGAKKYWSVSLLIPKSDKQQIEKIQKVIDAAIALGVEKKLFPARLPAKFINPLYDGDEKLDANGKPDPVYAGHYYISAKCEDKEGVSRPGFVDAQGKVMINPTDQEVYSGITGRANVNFYPYNNNSVGIGVGLNHLQKLRDGEKIGGKPALENAFDDDFVFQDEPVDDRFS